MASGYRAMLGKSDKNALTQASFAGTVQSSTVSSGTGWKFRRFLLSNNELVARAILAIRRSPVA
jgi:hypothetical protein